MDLSAAINRMRFDGLAAGVYRQVGVKVKSVIEECGLDVAQVDEVSGRGRFFWPTQVTEDLTV